jgi:hypothetical protein
VDSRASKGKKASSRKLDSRDNRDNDRKLEVSHREEARVDSKASSLSLVRRLMSLLLSRREKCWR